MWLGNHSQLRLKDSPVTGFDHFEMAMLSILIGCGGLLNFGVFASKIAKYRLKTDKMKQVGRTVELQFLRLYSTSEQHLFEFF